MSLYGRLTADSFRGDAAQMRSAVSVDYLAVNFYLKSAKFATQSEFRLPDHQRFNLFYDDSTILR